MDGNKRTGLACAAVFLLVNGWEPRAGEPEAVVVLRGIASGELGGAERGGVAAPAFGGGG